MKSYAHGALAGDDLQKRKGFERQEIGQRRWSSQLRLKRRHFTHWSAGSVRMRTATFRRPLVISGSDTMGPDTMKR